MRRESAGTELRVRSTIEVVAVVLVAVAMSACSGLGADKAEIGPPDQTSPADAGSTDPLTGEITLLAASSLTEVMIELADQFEAEHGGVQITPSFSSSAAIVAQVDAGAPSDAIATADERTMRQLTERGATTDLSVIALNGLEIAVEPGNPRGITGLDDLADDDLVVVACVSEAPCGNLADEVLADAGVTASIASREPNVKAALAKVELGEADVALVYHTDVIASDTEGVAVPSTRRNRYPITVSSGASEPQVAAAFVEFVTGETGRQVLSDFGFELP